MDLLYVFFSLIKMEFPITREKLKNYKNSEAVRLDIEKRIEIAIQEICKVIEQEASFSDRCVYMYHLGLHFGLSAKSQRDSIINELVVELKYKFPDSHIIPDHVKSCILIDWS